MQMVLLTFVIGVLNLCLGYALAVHLGCGPPTLRDAWTAMSAVPRAGQTCDDRSAGTDEPAQQPDKPRVIRPHVSCPSEPAPAADMVVEPKLSDREALRRSVDTATSSLTDLAARLKKSRVGQSGKTAWSFVGELQEICEPYARHLSKAAEGLCDEVGDSGEATAPSEEVQQIILEQMAQLETTLSNLQYMDFDSGFSAAMARLRTDTANTLAVTRRLQKALEAAPETTGEQDAVSVAG